MNNRIDSCSRPGSSAESVSIVLIPAVGEAPDEQHGAVDSRSSVGIVPLATKKPFDARAQRGTAQRSVPSLLDVGDVPHGLVTRRCADWH